MSRCADAFAAESVDGMRWRLAEKGCLFPEPRVTMEEIDLDFRVPKVEEFRRRPRWTEAASSYWIGAARTQVSDH